MTIDFTRYAWLLDHSSWHMDDVHVQMLHDLVLEHRPATVMEIGSYRGRSAVAYFAALDAGADFHLHLVEPRPQPTLLQLIEESGHADRVTLHRTGSWDLGIPADFVFIDGHHGWPALADALSALTLGAQVIAFHDTCAWEHGADTTWGCHLAAKLLRGAVGRQWHEDAEPRAWMKTERGFGWSVKNAAPAPAEVLH